MHPPTVEELASDLDELRRVITQAADCFGISARLPTHRVEELAVLLKQAHEHSACQVANHEGYRSFVLDSSARNPHPPGSPSYQAWHAGANQAEEDTDIS